MDPIFVFLLSGTFSMSAAMFASKLLKLPEDQKPEWLKTQSGKVKALLGGNLVALILVASMVYGIYHLIWWIPLACLFVSFPVIHVIFLERILGEAKGFVFSGLIAIVSAPLLWFFW